MFSIYFSVVVSASVVESTETYFCQEASQILKSEHARRATDCEQSWTVKSVVRQKYYNFNYCVFKKITDELETNNFQPVDENHT